VFKSDFLNNFAIFYYFKYTNKFITEYKTKIITKYIAKNKY